MVSSLSPDPIAVQVAAPGGSTVKVIRAPLHPQFRFEYHRLKKKVYVVRVGGKPEIGEVFAHEIENDGQAHNAVLVWLRGYRAAKGERWNDAGKLIEVMQ